MQAQGGDGSGILTPPPPSRTARAARIAAWCLAIAAVDLWSKSFVFARVAADAPWPWQGTRPVIEGFLHLTPCINHGGVWGIRAGSASNAIFCVAALGAVAALLRLATGPGWRATPAADAAIGMILGGAIGNVHDRLALGGVRDFIDFHWRRYAYPTFNLADAAICAGAALLAWHLTKGKTSPSGSGSAPSS